jgi:hypothetical protein
VADAGGRTLQDLPVNLGTVFSIITITFGIAIWLMRQFMKRDERLGEIVNRLVRIETTLDNHIARSDNGKGPTVGQPKQK